MTDALAVNSMTRLYVPAPNRKNARPMTMNVSQRRDRTVRWNQRLSIAARVSQSCKRGARELLAAGARSLQPEELARVAITDLRLLVFGEPELVERRERLRQRQLREVRA